MNLNMTAADMAVSLALGVIGSAIFAAATAFVPAWWRRIGDWVARLNATWRERRLRNLEAELSKLTAEMQDFQFYAARAFFTIFMVGVFTYFAIIGIIGVAGVVAAVTAAVHDPEIRDLISRPVLIACALAGSMLMLFGHLGLMTQLWFGLRYLQPKATVASYKRRIERLKQSDGSPS